MISQCILLSLDVKSNTNKDHVLIINKLIIMIRQMYQAYCLDLNLLDNGEYTTE